MQTTLLSAAALALAALLLPAAPAAAQTAWVPEEVTAFCESPPDIDPEAYSRAPVDLDGTEAEFLYAGGVSCDGIVAPFCGSGGCSLWARVAGQTFEWQAEAWEMIDWRGIPILLIARDGGWCGGIGAQTCFEALNWSGDRFLTVMPQTQP